jgi:hypothetical protein
MLDMTVLIIAESRMTRNVSAGWDRGEVREGKVSFEESLVGRTVVAGVTSRREREGGAATELSTRAMRSEDGVGSPGTTGMIGVGGVLGAREERVDW